MREYHRRAAEQRREHRSLAAMQADSQQHLAQTGPYAYRDSVAWTPDEDARLLADPEMSAPEMARALGRSATSIRMRRMRLRRRAT